MNARMYGELYGHELGKKSYREIFKLLIYIQFYLALNLGNHNCLWTNSNKYKILTKIKDVNQQKCNLIADKHATRFRVKYYSSQSVS